MDISLNNINRNIDKLFINSEIINGNTLIFKPIQHFDNLTIEALFVRNEIITLVHKLLNYSSGFKDYMTLDTLKILLDIKCTEYYKSKCIFMENNIDNLKNLDNFKQAFYTYINETVEEFVNKYNGVCMM